MTARSTPTVKPKVIYLFVLLSLSLGIAACHPASTSEGRGFLADWSPDGTHIALVPDCMDDEPEYSGLWIYDSKTARIVQAIAGTDTQIYLHPRWSPDGIQILIAVVEKQDVDSHHESESIPFSVYVVDSRGLSRRKVVDSISPSGDAFLIPNTIMWGAKPDTVIYQQASGDKVTARQLNLGTGVSSQYLPDAADLYYLQPSPDRHHIVCLLYEEESQTARIYLSGFETTNWRLLEKLKIQTSTVGSLPSMISWAPDSSAFVVREKAEEAPGAETGRQYMRLFEIRTGLSHRIGTCDRASVIFWNQEGTALIFSDNNPALGEGICRVDLASGIVRLIVPSGQYTLLSWNQEDGRIYFCRTAADKSTNASGNDQILENRLFYCDGEGKGAGLMGRFYTRNDLRLILSPNGSRMILFDDPFAPGYLDLTSGDGQPVPLER